MGLTTYTRNGLLTSSPTVLKPFRGIELYIFYRGLTSWFRSDQLCFTWLFFDYRPLGGTWRGRSVDWRLAGEDVITPTCFRSLTRESAVGGNGMVAL